jgi:hypothetical protein
MENKNQKDNDYLIELESDFAMEKMKSKIIEKSNNDNINVLKIQTKKLNDDMITMKVIDNKNNEYIKNMDSRLLALQNNGNINENIKDDDEIVKNLKLQLIDEQENLKNMNIENEELKTKIMDLEKKDLNDENKTIFEKKITDFENEVMLFGGEKEATRERIEVGMSDMYIHMCVYGCIFVFIYVYEYKCICIYLYFMDTYAYLYLYTCVLCTHIYLHVYTCINRLLKS